MTENSLFKAIGDLSSIISNHAMNDYLQSNFKKGKKKSKKHISYSLSLETLEAKELYNSIYMIEAANITPELEEKIKGYLLPYRTFRSEYLIHTEKKKEFKMLER